MEFPIPLRPDNWADEVAEVHHMLTVVYKPYLRYVWEYVPQDTRVSQCAIEVQMTPKSAPVKTEFTDTPLKAYDLLVKLLSGPAASVQPSTPSATTSA